MAEGTDVPEYRTFALWKAALGIDGYTTHVSQWLDDPTRSHLLDIEPSPRIRAHLKAIQLTGSLPELSLHQSPAQRACLRLRALRGLGAKLISEALCIRRDHHPDDPTAMKGAALVRGPQS